MSAPHQEHGSYVIAESRLVKQLKRDHTLLCECTTGAYEVRWFEDAPGTWIIQHGLQTTLCLSSMDAAHEYGECVMLSLRRAALLHDVNRTDPEGRANGSAPL